MRIVTAREQVAMLSPWRTAMNPMDEHIEAHPDYYYHGTSHWNAQDIQDEGHLHPHAPDYGTDQAAWPDTGTEDRSYWSHDPSIVRSFYPEEGHPTLLRAPRKVAPFKPERGTSDYYSSHPISTEHLEAYSGGGNWTPLSEWNHTARRRTYASLLWAGFDPMEVTKRLKDEFHDWHMDQPPNPDPVHGERIDNNALGHWPTVENFLKDKYPAAHRGFAMGLEDASHHLRDPHQTYHSPMHMDDDPEGDGSHFDANPPEPYQTDPHTIKQLGYDPEEVAAGMVLLHNRAHSGRQDAYLEDNKKQLVDIFNKRQKMQQDYEQRAGV